MKNEKGLSEQLAFLFYLMSRLEQVAVHVINYEQLQEKLQEQKSQNAISDKYDSEKLSEVGISEKINKKMVMTFKEIIQPMLNSNQSKMLGYFEQNLPLFIKYCSEIDHLNYRLDPYRKYSYSNDRKQLEDARKRVSNKKLDPIIQQKILLVIDRLFLHFRKIDVLTKQNLEDLLFMINFEDFKKSLFGTLLMYVCIMITINPQVKKMKFKVSQKTFNAFAQRGSILANKLNDYTDELMELVSTPVAKSIVNFKITESLQAHKPKNSLSESELNESLGEFRKYENKKISIEELYPILYKLKEHFQARYNVESKSIDIFENLASMIKEILDKKTEIYQPEYSLDLEVIEYILTLNEITPLKADVAELLPSILNLKST